MVYDKNIFELNSKPGTIQCSEQNVRMHSPMRLLVFQDVQPKILKMLKYYFAVFPHLLALLKSIIA